MVRKLTLIDTSTIKARTFNKMTKFVKLVEIYDGDTFKIITKLDNHEGYRKYSVRLSGIDAPEVRPNKHTPYQKLHKQAGIHVRDILRSKFPQGTIFIVDFDKEEKYGRLMGNVYTIKKNLFGNYMRGTNLCLHLVSLGLALPYGGQEKACFTEDVLDGILKVNI